MNGVTGYTDECILCSSDLKSTLASDTGERLLVNGRVTFFIRFSGVSTILEIEPVKIFRNSVIVIVIKFYISQTLYKITHPYIPTAEDSQVRRISI